MLLTQKQEDALVGFMNLILSRRTATALSDLIQSPVVLEVSGISLYPLGKCAAEFSDTFKNDVASIHQTLSGPHPGDCLMLLDYYVAVMLTNLLCRRSGQPIVQLNISACEVLTEMGNILLGSFVRILGNLMGGSISISDQLFSIDPVDELVHSLIVEHQEIRYVLIVDLTFLLCDNSVPGYLLFVSGVMPLSCAIRGIEALGNLAGSKSLR